MTVSELIRLLGAYPEDMRVIVSGCEEGYDDVSAERVGVTEVWPNGGTYEWQRQIIEFFESEKDAVKTGKKDYGKGRFSVQQVSDICVDLGIQSNLI